MNTCQKIFLSASLLGISHSVSAQIENAGMADEFKEMSRFGTRQSGYEGIQTYNSGIIEGNRFFSGAWAPGTVTTIYHTTFGKDYSFLFDKLGQDLYMKWKDSAVIFLAEKDQLESFALTTDTVHTFVAAAVYDPSHELAGDFLEVIVQNEKGFSLLKLEKTKLVAADPGNMIKQGTGEVYDHYEDQTSYYLSLHHGLPQKITLKEKSLRSILAQKTGPSDRYFATHRGEPIDEAFIKNLINYINQ